MQAIVQRVYGSPEVLALADVEVPPVGDDDVLVRIHAAAVNPGDLFSVVGRPYVARLATGPLRPRRSPGRAFAGTVDRAGGNVSRVAPGDAVYGEVPGGAYAEYLSVPEKVVARTPHNLTLVQAAAVPLAGVTALQGLRDAGRVGEGSRVLINGASGGVGTLAVQIARSLGAEVTAVCSTAASELVRSLGADHVVDYTREDFTRSGQDYDVVFDLVGTRSLGDCRRALTPTGTLVLSSGPPSPTIRRILKALALSPFTRQRLVPLAQRVRSDDLDHLTALIEAGEVTPVVERTFPLAQAADALRHQQAGHARGRIVITIAS